MNQPPILALILTLSGAPADTPVNPPEPIMNQPPVAVPIDPGDPFTTPVIPPEPDAVPAMNQPPQ
jgi:hypothetical protein